MKVGVIGSRGFEDYELMATHLDLIKSDIELVISGGARGADTLAERWARQNNIPTRIFKPDWQKFGKAAGFIRNKDIVSNADLVLAFWDGKSKGTKLSIDLCVNKSVKLKIINY